MIEDMPSLPVKIALLAWKIDKNWSFNGSKLTAPTWRLSN
jgi:hypothetical protein